LSAKFDDADFFGAVLIEQLVHDDLLSCCSEGGCNGAWL